MSVDRRCIHERGKTAIESFVAGGKAITGVMDSGMGIIDEASAGNWKGAVVKGKKLFKGGGATKTATQTGGFNWG
jgi:hypothetical protein